MSKKRRHEKATTDVEDTTTDVATPSTLYVDRAIERFFETRVRRYVDKKFRSLRRELDDAVADAVVDAMADFENAREERETRSDDLREFEKEDNRDLRLRDDDDDEESEDDDDDESEEDDDDDDEESEDDDDESDYADE
jgi:hypothetical protein